MLRLETDLGHYGVRAIAFLGEHQEIRLRRYIEKKNPEIGDSAIRPRYVLFAMARDLFINSAAARMLQK